MRVRSCVQLPLDLRVVDLDPELRPGVLLELGLLDELVEQLVPLGPEGGRAGGGEAASPSAGPAASIEANAARVTGSSPTSATAFAGTSFGPPFPPHATSRTGKQESRGQEVETLGIAGVSA